MNKTMIDKNNLKFYTSPKSKVVDIKTRQVLCGSVTPEQYHEGTWEW